MATSKRHHYLPRFLLRRFSMTEGRWAGHVWRLDLRSGKITPAVPRTEASKNRYYELPDQVVGGLQPEKLLARIESEAAGVIGRLESGGAASSEDLTWLALFALLQWKRTPTGRRQAKALDEALGREEAELKLSAKERVIEFIREHEPGISDEEAEQQRLDLLDDLRSGRITFESPPEREVALMFLALPEVASQLVEKCDWTLVRFPAECPLVLPDTGVTRYDPNPKIPGSGSGFLGTPSVETAIHLSPDTALLITPGGGRTDTGEAEAGDAVEFNLRAYAASEICVYGQDQELLKDVRVRAKRNPVKVGERQPLAPTLWIGESDPRTPPNDPVRFTGYSVDGTRTQELYIAPEANRERGLRPEDLWPKPDEHDEE